MNPGHWVGSQGSVVQLALGLRNWVSLECTSTLERPNVFKEFILKFRLTSGY